MDCRSELSQSPIKIPERFHQVLYNYDRYPGAPGVRVSLEVLTASNTPTNFCAHEHDSRVGLCSVSASPLPPGHHGLRCSAGTGLDFAQCWCLADTH
jgi:hypothetical protein